MLDTRCSSLAAASSEMRSWPLLQLAKHHWLANTARELVLTDCWLLQSFRGIEGAGAGHHGVHYRKSVIAFLMDHAEHNASLVGFLPYKFVLSTLSVAVYYPGHTVL